MGGTPGSTRRDGAIRTALLASFVLLATAYSIVIPAFNAPDEPYHFEYVRFLATEAALPDQTQDDRRISTEGFNPPLYYAVAAALLRSVSDDRAADLRILPHRDVVSFMRNPAGGFPSRPHPPPNPRYLKWRQGHQPNMFLTTPADRFPFIGGIRAIHWLRGLSVLMGALTLLFVWRTAELAFPERREVPILATAVSAFNPQFAFLSASVNNDNLVVLLSSAAIFLTTRLLTSDPSERTTPRALVCLGLILGLALLTKLNAAAIAAACLGAIVYRTLATGGSWAAAARASAWASVPMLLVSGWFYARGILLFGASDPLGLRLRALQNPDLVMPPGATLSFFRDVFFQRLHTTYWGHFDWLTLRLPEPAYLLYALIPLLSLAGVVRLWRNDPSRRQIVAMTYWVCALALCFFALVLLNRVFLSAQARLLFPAIAGTSVLMGAGLGTLGRALLGEGRSRGLPAIAIATALLLAGSVWALLAVILPAYR